jgi:hypothetical protein
MLLDDPAVNDPRARGSSDPTSAGCDGEGADTDSDDREKGVKGVVGKCGAYRECRRM